MGAQQSQEDGAAASSADDGLSQWRVPTDERRRLPAMHPSAVASSSALLVAIAGVVYDLTSFADDHPGGREVLDAHRGQDATEAFIEAVHPYGAVWPQMKDMRVGVLREEGDDEGQQKEVAATKAEATSSVGDSQVSGSRHRRRCRVLYGTQTGSARSQQHSGHTRRGGRHDQPVLRSSLLASCLPLSQTTPKPSPATSNSGQRSAARPHRQLSIVSPSALRLTRPPAPSCLWCCAAELCAECSRGSDGGRGPRGPVVRGAAPPRGGHLHRRPAACPGQGSPARTLLVCLPLLSRCQRGSHDAAAAVRRVSSSATG